MPRILAGDQATAGGTATSTVVKQSVANPFTGKASFAHQVAIANTGGTNALKVYLPNNATAITIPANSEKVFDGPIWWFAVQAAASTTTWEARLLVA